MLEKQEAGHGGVHVNIDLYTLKLGDCKLEASWDQQSKIQGRGGFKSII